MAENHDVALEVRFMVECMARLHQLLYGRRCIVCASEITNSNPATITVAGMSVCKNPACAAIVLHVSLSELTGIDDDEPLHE